MEPGYGNISSEVDLQVLYSHMREPSVRKLDLELCGLVERSCLFFVGGYKSLCQSADSG